MPRSPARTRSRSAASWSKTSSSSARTSSRTPSASCTSAQSSPPSPPGRPRSPLSSPERSLSSRANQLLRSSRAATGPPRRPLLSWVRNEDRHPSRVRPGARPLRLRQRVPDPLDQGRAARRGLLELPPVLHGEAEADGLGRPRRALPAPPREGRPQYLGTRGPDQTMSAPIGGQAVLEGVMMRGSSNGAVAGRKPNGQIAEVCRPIESVMKRHWFFRLPVVRGIVALGESLAIGFRALSISAQYAAQEEGSEAEEVQTELSRGALFFAFAVAIAFALLLFKVTPALITNWLPIETTGWFVLSEGSIRVTIFVLYLVLISMLPDLRRVFQYHAAEHKAINAYEAGEELTPQTVQRYSLIHPRCGTAFLLWVMVIAIFVFAFFGRPAWYWLIATRILLLPLIAGLAYELIRFAGKHTDNRLVMKLLAPGLWLQRLTTREPTLDQLEVSIRALREVLALEKGDTVGAERVEVMA